MVEGWRTRLLTGGNARMINILPWILLGGLLGWLVNRLGHRGNLIGAMLVGMLGALIGGAVFAIILPGMFGMAHLNVGSWAVSLLSAGILLFLVSGMSKTLREAVLRDS